MSETDQHSEQRQLIAERYLVLKKVGENDFISTYLAKDQVLARTVIVKILNEELSTNESIRDSFRVEAINAARLVHPNIVATFDTGVHNNQEFVVMERTQGTRLDKELEENEGTRISINKVAHIGRKIALALSYAHDRGHIHGSLKSKNVYIDQNVGVKVADFGVNSDSKKIFSEDTIGDKSLHIHDTKQLYIKRLSPEEHRGQPIDKRTDLWALGIILYELLTGSNPLDNLTRPQSRLTDNLANPSLVRGDIPTDLADLILLLTAGNQENRPSDASRVAQALARFEHGSFDNIDTTEKGFSIDLGALLPISIIIIIGIFFIIDYIPKASSSNNQTIKPPSTAQVEEPKHESIVSSIIDISSLDPQGDGRERDDLLDSLLDPATATSWMTEPYHSPDFGGLKDGVGVLLDLGSAKHLSQIIFSTPQGGFDVNIGYSSTPDSNFEAFKIVETARNVSDGENSIDISEETFGRYVLFWITGELPKDDDKYRAKISNIKIMVEP